jgi:uncharacterized membrane protein YdjX (TVP38/TMEM64 family)
MNASRLARILGFLFLLTALVCSVLFFAPLQEWLTGVLHWIEDLGLGGLVLLVVVYIVGTVLFFPGSIITLGAGAIFGFVRGYLAVTVGSVLGACAAFWIGRTLAREWVARRVSGYPRFRAIDRAVGSHGFKIVLLTRLSPVFPFTLLNYAFGLTCVSFRAYALASFLGMIPGTIMYVSLGAGAGKLARVLAGDYEGSAAEQVLFFAGLALTVVTVVLVTRIAKKALARTIPSTEVPPNAPSPSDAPSPTASAQPPDDAEPPSYVPPR